MKIQDITRRGFLKAGLGAAAAFGGLEFIAGCSTTETAKPSQIEAVPASVKAEPVVYPRLADKKVQAPENGCLVGFRKVYAMLDSAEYKELFALTKKAKDLDELLRTSEPLREKVVLQLINGINNNIDGYHKDLDRKPYIYCLYDTPRIFQDFPDILATPVANKVVIPYIYLGTYVSASAPRKDLDLQLNDIAKGKHDHRIKNSAKGASEFGKKHGGFFITTMEESNADWYYWGQNSNFIPAWRRIWQIFEDQGANKYATWVWECAPPATAPNRTKHPDITYPGDKYIDWIGLSAFSRKGQPSAGLTLGALSGQTYDQMRKNHPDKPIMQAEFAVSNDGAQPRWLMDAYQTIKSIPGMKAAIYFDHVTAHERDDHTLSKKSLESLKEIFKDPYWIMAK
jgi:hypothetical protein